MDCFGDWTTSDYIAQLDHDKIEFLMIQIIFTCESHSSEVFELHFRTVHIPNPIDSLTLPSR